MLKDGASRLYGTVNEVKEQFGGQVLEIVSEGHIPVNERLYSIERREGNTTLLAPSADLLMIQRSLIAAGIAYTKFELKRPSLDDIFVEVYGSHAKEEKQRA